MTSADVNPSDAPDPSSSTPASKPPSSARQLFCMTILVCEAFVVFFAALVAYGLQLASGATVAVAGSAGALLCVMAAGLLRRGPAGYAVGTAVQVLLLVAGIWIPAMLVVGGVFAVLWVIALRLGSRIDRERVERLRAAATGEGAAG